MPVFCNCESVPALCTERGHVIAHKKTTGLSQIKGPSLHWFYSPYLWTLVCSWVTEYPKLEGTHKNHHVQLLALQRTTQESDCMSESAGIKCWLVWKGWTQAWLSAAHTKSTKPWSILLGGCVAVWAGKLLSYPTQHIFLLRSELGVVAWTVWLCSAGIKHPAGVSYTNLPLVNDKLSASNHVRNMDGTIIPLQAVLWLTALQELGLTLFFPQETALNLLQPPPIPCTYSWGFGSRLDPSFFFLMEKKSNGFSKDSLRDFL